MNLKPGIKMKSSLLEKNAIGVVTRWGLPGLLFIVQWLILMEYMFKISVCVEYIYIYTYIHTYIHIYTHIWCACVRFVWKRYMCLNVGLCFCACCLSMVQWLIQLKWNYLFVNIYIYTYCIWFDLDRSMDRHNRERGCIDTIHSICTPVVSTLRYASRSPYTNT